jgi:glycosyltransferase involved in cell wall biosynthesis
LSAYSCAPGEGSEPEAGLKVLAIAAQHHDVSLAFRADQRDRLEPWLATQNLRPVELIPVDVPGFRFTHNRLRSFGHYLLWQRALRSIARRHDEETNFEVVHHVTYATYYTPIGVTSVEKPLVWGPVGGADRAPIRLWRALGWKGIAGEVLRLAAQAAFRLAFAMPPKRSTRMVVLAQNHATAQAIDSDGIRIVPNGTAVTVESGFDFSVPERTKEVVTVARLIGWKGVWLAIEAMRHVRLATKLRIMGEGPDRQRLLRRVRRLGLEDRIEFLDRVPRDLMMKIVRSAGVFLHPALRDEASLAVGEAMSLGTPVVVLEGTGAHGVAATWKDGYQAVSPSSLKATVRSLAAAVDRALADPQPVLTSPRTSDLNFSEEILWAYRSAADHS